MGGPPSSVGCHTLPEWHRHVAQLIPGVLNGEGTGLVHHSDHLWAHRQGVARRDPITDPARQFNQAGSQGGRYRKAGCRQPLGLGQ